MTETTTTDAPADPAPDAATAAKTPRRRATGLSGKVLAELQEIASGLGIAGAGKMRKGPLIEAIKQAQGAGPATNGDAAVGSGERADVASVQRAAERDTERAPEAPAGTAPTTDTSDREARGADAGRQAASKRDDQKRDDQKQDGEQDRTRQERGHQQSRNAQDRGNHQDRTAQDRGSQDRGHQQNRNAQDRNAQDRNAQDRNQQDRAAQDDDDEDGGGRRRNRNRNRNRNRGKDRDRGPDGEPILTDDDVLLPAAGILDVLDNYAFVRTSGYLPGPSDVYVSLSMVRKWGLRRGDAIVGQVRQTREGERKEKFNPLVSIESINGMGLEEARKRVEFSKLTPLYPDERLRLETDAEHLTGRIIDLVAPLGKGQRGLIVSPPKAGKTMVMQQIANAISTNNPECHLMIVLVDERPEEVTDFQRTVKGEVIASTFDRPASDHTTVAELAIERAKRLVELGHDVVVLLDGITRLGRAYNLATPASGRILSGGVDSAALYPPKKFFGAARNIEDGGSLTIVATALVETGSRMDEVIFEEFKGTGNSELRLRRDFADKRIYPAIDAVASGTRREELVMGREERQVVWRLRRLLAGLEGQQGLELLLERLRKSSSNREFLQHVQTTTPGQED